MGKTVEMNVPATATHPLARAAATSVKSIPASLQQRNIAIDALRPDQRVQINIGGGEAAGAVLAEGFVDMCRKQGTGMVAWLKDIAGLSLDGHKAFRAGLTKARAEANLYWKGREATTKDDGTIGRPAVKPGIKEGSKLDKLAPALTRSAFTRMSEATTFSKAMAAGFSPDFTKGHDFYFLMAEARLYIASAAEKSGTKTEGRGRKAMTVVEKVKAYIERQGLTKRQRESVATSLLGEAQQ